MADHKNIGFADEKAPWRSNAVFILLLAMLFALFYSRALLSISMFGMFAVTVLHRNFIRQLKDFATHPFLAGIALLFLVPFISGLWSSNTGDWQNAMRVKLPLLFTPIVFAGKWQLSEARWRLIGLVFIALTVIAAGWSLWQYLQDMQAVHEGYLRSKVIRTPLDNDHIRFSWMVTIAVLTCIWFIHYHPRASLKIFCGLAAVWLSIYLHIVSARTGLATLYMILGIYILWALFSQRSKPLAIAGLTVLVVIPAMAWLLFPTFQNRIRYMVYDLSHVSTHTYLPGSNDGSRFMSLRAGWGVLKENPLGVGMGDIKDEAVAWYDRNIPGMIPADKIEPSSEWLFYGNAAGWPGLLIFTAVMLVPFFLRGMRYPVFWVALNATAAFTFVFDIGLEGQYGVFLYGFLVFWWWKWFSQAIAR